MKDQDIKSQYVHDSKYEKFEILDMLKDIIKSNRGGAKTPPLKYTTDPFLEQDNSESSYTSCRSFNKSNKSVKKKKIK